MDRSVGEYSYSIYLCHTVILSLWAPLRHFIPETLKIYILILMCLVLCTFVIKIDEKIQFSLRRKFTEA